MDPVGICNLALGWLGSQPITAFDDASTQAELCSANWAAVRDSVLEARAWTWAVKRGQLAADATAPEYGWGVRYQVPSDLLRILEVDDGSGYADFEWVREGAYLLSDQGAPVYIRYVSRVEDTSLWSPGAVMALAYRLASTLCIPLTENASQLERLWKLYERSLLEAGRADGFQGRAESVRPSVIATRRRW